MRDGVTKFFDGKPEFDIRRTSIQNAVIQPDAFDHLDAATAPNVIGSLKTLQRVQALTSKPETLPALLNSGVASASQVAAMPQSKFLKLFGESLDENDALRIHDNAMRIALRNEQALTQMHQAVRGTGLAAIDGGQDLNSRVATFEKTAKKYAVNINLEELFGSIDFCECDDCTSLTSPAAYFVDLLQYLRNNNLDPTVDSETRQPKFPNTGKSGYANTALEKLLRRRPDIQHIELTCENTNTLIPYVDLVNEVMESFIFHEESYIKNWTQEKQVEIDAFNVRDETSNELLAEAQHTNYTAYCLLRQAVFPLGSLPYHQPINSIRIYLEFLKTSRNQLMDIFRRPFSSAKNLPQTPEMHEIYDETVDRAVEAEFLGVIQEEYIILTKESFWPKRYFEIMSNATLRTEAYQEQIGVRQIREYWGYSQTSDMMSDDEVEKIGLSFVKNQFLKRSGMLYTELVDLVKTNYVNPWYPSGSALALLQSIRFSYRFLQLLIDNTADNSKEKYRLLVEFLFFAQPWVGVYDLLTYWDGKNVSCKHYYSRKEICDWVHEWFECLGKLVVLESGEGPTLPVHGRVVFRPHPNDDGPDVIGPRSDNPGADSAPESSSSPLLLATSGEARDGPETPAAAAAAAPLDQDVGFLKPNGEIINSNSETIALVMVDSRVYTKDGKLLIDKWPEGQLLVLSSQDSLTHVIPPIAIINDEGYLQWAGARGRHGEIVRWNRIVDTCDIKKVRLLHLNGTNLSLDEWDRLQRFIRLWKCMGWSIDETDKALWGLSMNPPSTPNDPNDEPVDSVVGFSDFAKEDCRGSAGNGGDNGGCCGCKGSCRCGDVEPVPKPICEGITLPDISPDFMKELVGVKKLLDLTGLEVIKLLALWAPISTSGEKSLYSRLFLTHNLLGIDEVFKADDNGAYLVTSTKIVEHIPVILAALRIKRDELMTILTETNLLTSDLTLQTISTIYKHVVISQSLKIKASLLFEAIQLFGSPFINASSAVTFFIAYNEMTDEGFNVQQLWYATEGRDDPLKPLGPSQLGVLRTAKALSDGLNAIDEAHKDLKEAEKDSVTEEMVTAKTSLLFDSAVVASINDLLAGRSVYVTNVPIGLTVIVPEALGKKLNYSDPADALGSNRRAKLTVVGILTAEELAAAKALVPNTDWAAALERVKKQAVSFFRIIISSVFPDQEGAMSELLAGDVLVPDDQVTPDQPNPNTPPKKRSYFLQSFLKYLRDQLYDQLVVNTMTGKAGISSPEATTLLLKDLLVGDGGETALNILKGVRSIGLSQPAGTWTGYLIPPANGSYSFVGYGATRPNPVQIDSLSVPFPKQQEDPNDVWFTEPQDLIGGKLYLFKSNGQPVPGLGWMTPRTAVVEIPPSALIPDYSTQTVKETFVKIVRASITINGFGLSVDDIDYIQAHPTDFGGFDLNDMKIEAWKQVLRFTKFRSSLPTRETTLVDFYQWTYTATDTTSLSQIANQLANVTGWAADKLLALLDPTAFSLTKPVLFRDIATLLRIQKALEVANNVAIDLPLLFRAANPMAKFWPTHDLAEEIRKSIRSRYSLDDWEQAVKPLHDRLRMSERNALVAYLVVQEQLIKWGVVDADSLFEFFLIDVQMGACLKTSRLKQAISTVQLFVQRCILGLEEKYGVENDLLDQSRWVALSKETVRTANVKVLLTPENYVVSSLRDDKSPLYETLEKDILQKDINPAALRDSLKSYLYGLDSIGNLRAEGLFQDDDESKTVYIVAKTRSTPYLFYYRTYSPLAQVWTPWQLVSVDIPSYQVESTTTSRAYDGCYINPVVWQNRFFIFFAELAKKTIPKALGNGPLAEATSDEVQPLETWEIKLGWSELRNGKWTQKKTTVDSVMESATQTKAPSIDSYRFVSRFMGTEPLTWISIDAYKDTNSTPIGRFEFQGSQAYAAPLETNPPKIEWWESTSFHFTGRWSTVDPLTMHCFQSKTFELNIDGANEVKRLPYASYPQDARSTSTFHISSSTVPFYHTFSHELLSRINTSETLDPVFDTYKAISNTDNVLLQSAFGLSGNELTTDGSYAPTFHELFSPYALYNWECGFHAPMQLADSLLQNQQFEAALAMCHFVFDPYADGNATNRVWKWKPFSLVSSEAVLDALFNSLQPNQADKTAGQITQWRNNPFMPHVVARSRPTAYMKWTVMKYLEILIAYGDYYFRQNSLEAVPLAIQCYVLASHIYGPSGQKIPKRGKKKPQTYFSLLDKWDAISNAVVDLELSFPFSNQIPHPYQFNGKEISLANIFGFATARYFCIPDNPQLRAVRNTIDDRLYKIRHCQDINGNAISLALWDPPLDPMLLVNMAAQGLSLANVLNDLNAPMPNYRFQYLLQKALEFCAELRSMGERFLSLKEKKDALSLELLKSTHENNMHRLVMDVRKLQVDEANKTIEALRINRNGPHYRYKLFAALGGFNQPDIIEEDTSYQPIALKAPETTNEGDMVMTPVEQNEMVESKRASEKNTEVGYIEIENAFLESLPTCSLSFQPWGMGVSIGMGPQNIAAHKASHARYIRIQSDNHTFTASNSSRKATYIRQQQDRIQLANSAAYEVKSIDAQIATQKTRVLMAGQELTNQQAQIDNSAEVLDFLKNKYTNDELYSWMETSVRTLYYQTYTLAYDLAKKAEAAFIFDRGPQTSPFIRFGYWNSGRDGLQSGEQLYLALKQMEAAYQDKRGHDFEIVKSISLRQTNPLALLELREKGSCQIDLPEVLFDMDWPGHYFRRIRSVSMTVPCVVGPYTSLNATLRLLNHRYRFSPTVVDSKSYPEQTQDGPDERFKMGAIPIDSIAVSTGQNDGGTFELNFKDERYNPFEGAGVISSWQIELPPTIRQFDYSSITDVVLRVMYIASNGGEKMKTAASASVDEFLKATTEDGAGFVALFDLRSEFATEWARASRPSIPTTPPSTAPRSITMTDLRSRLPFFTKMARAVNVSEVTLATTTDLPGTAYSIVTDPASPDESLTFGGGATTVGKMSLFKQTGVERELGDWTLNVQVNDAKMILDKIFVIISYVLS